MSVTLDREIIANPENWKPIIPGPGKGPTGWVCYYNADADHAFQCSLTPDAEDWDRTIIFHVLPHVTGDTQPPTFEFRFPRPMSLTREPIVRGLQDRLEKLEFTLY